MNRMGENGGIHRYVPSGETRRIMQRNRTFAAIVAGVNGISATIAFVLGTLPTPLLEQWDTAWGWLFVVGIVFSGAGAGQTIERQFISTTDARRAAGAVLVAALIGTVCAVVGWVAILWLNL